MARYTRLLLIEIVLMTPPCLRVGLSMLAAPTWYRWRWSTTPSSIGQHRRPGAVAVSARASCHLDEWMSIDEEQSLRRSPVIVNGLKIMLLGNHSIPNPFIVPSSSWKKWPHGPDRKGSPTRTPPGEIVMPSSSIPTFFMNAPSTSPASSWNCVAYYSILCHASSPAHSYLATPTSTSTTLLTSSTAASETAWNRSNSSPFTHKFHLYQDGIHLNHHGCLILINMMCKTSSINHHHSSVYMALFRANTLQMF